MLKKFSFDNNDAARRFMGPGSVDTQLRSARDFLWRVVPQERRNLEAVAAEFRALVDRVLGDMKREPREFFDFPGKSSAGDFPDDPEQIMSAAFAERLLRGAVMTCWMMLPADGRSPEQVETQFRRLVDRALRDMREDAAAFGLKDI